MTGSTGTLVNIWEPNEKHFHVTVATINIPMTYSIVSLAWNALLYQNISIKLKNASSSIALNPVLSTVEGALHFTSLTDMLTQTPCRLLWETSNSMLQLIREGHSYTYPPLSIARYTFIQLRELEQWTVKKCAQDFNTEALHSNPGYRSRVWSSTPEPLRWRHINKPLYTYPCMLISFCSLANCKRVNVWRIFLYSTNNFCHLSWCVWLLFVEIINYLYYYLGEN